MEKAYRQKEQDSMEKAVTAYLDGCLSVKEIHACRLQRVKDLGLDDQKQQQHGHALENSLFGCHG
ncbi:hypothetical protein Cni_G07022 [Canna indica]|uniref:Uncharacterized protein n=1 Tax=Canna indica TaxID=4628 RepID=A0AAQ3K0E3_9LILI|nr:hypothetical protein Cni_G07022 [Canna indica]